LGLRSVASGAGINVQRLVTGRINEAEWARVARVAGTVHDLPVQFCELGGLTVLELRTLARQAQREFGGLSVIVVDYLQLMIGSTDNQNRAAELSVITRGLKLLAKELKVPVVALSQLNRDLEKRGNKRPVLSDLRDSGSIEQDADLVWFIYRDEVYNPNSDDRGFAEVITAKQRNGPTGVDRLRFRGDFTRFSNEVVEDGS
jgi:replicative DNA helicase